MALQFVLDLDETLVHTSYEVADSFYDTSDGLLTIHMRPYTKEFISFLHQHGYPYGFFTASSDDYADRVVKEYIGSKDHMFIYSSNDCLPEYGDGPRKFKSLDMIWRRHPTYRPESTIIVDDLDSTYGMHRLNWYKIPEWEGRMDDEALKVLMEKIESVVSKVPFDIRMITD